MLLPRRYAGALPAEDAGTITLAPYDGLDQATAAAAEAEVVWIDLGRHQPGEMERLVAASGCARWFFTGFAGMERMPLDLIAKTGAVLTNGSGIHSEPMAEQMVAGLLAGFRGLPALQRAQAKRHWEPDANGRRELLGSSALVLGYGATGRAVASRLRGLGVRVTGFRRRDPVEDGVHVGEGWREMLPATDMLVLTLPLTRVTRHLVGAPELAALRQGAWIANPARGALIDQTALVEALRSGSLGGVVLDCYETEPLPPDDPLWDIPNAILSPHSSWASERTEERIVALFRENLRLFLAGQEMLNVVDLEAGY